MKKLLAEYFFSPSSGNIFFPSENNLEINRFLLITNVGSGKNEIIYNFVDPEAGGIISGESGNYLVLNKSGIDLMSSGDPLQIFYDYPETDPVSTLSIDFASGIYSGYVTGSGFSGVIYYDPVEIPFSQVGGRAVDISSGFFPNYEVNSGAMLNIERNNGALLSYQADLDKDIDSVTTFPVGYSSTSNYTTGIVTPDNATGTAPIVVSGNSNRITIYGQNMGNTPLYVKYGAGASSSSFSFVLKPGTGWMDWNGEKWTDDLYKGDVSVNVSSGESGCFIFWEGV